MRVPAFFKRANLRTISNPLLVLEKRRWMLYQSTWRLIHNGAEHAGCYDYLIRIDEELSKRNITIPPPSE